MTNDLMVSRLHHGNEDIHLSGMSHVLATSYELQATLEAGVVVALAERENMNKYETTAQQTHLFCSIAIETSGVFGPDASAIICDLACRMKDASMQQAKLKDVHGTKYFRCGAERQYICPGVCQFRFRCSAVIYMY